MSSEYLEEDFNDPVAKSVHGFFRTRASKKAINKHNKENILQVFNSELLYHSPVTSTVTTVLTVQLVVLSGRV